MEHLQQAKHWLDQCRQNHPIYQAVRKDPYQLPGRMIHVVDGDGWVPGKPPETLKLVDTGTGPLEYVAFSHCWGPPELMRFKLTAKNKDACYDELRLDDLSKNMQDAITTCVNLGFSYIWIDSLCIIQKEPEEEDTGQKDTGDAPANISNGDTPTNTGNAEKAPWLVDWENKSKKMGDVYSDAACTIASTASRDSSGGCFHERSQISLVPCELGRCKHARRAPGWQFLYSIFCSPIIFSSLSSLSSYLSFIQFPTFSPSFPPTSSVSSPDATEHYDTIYVRCDDALDFTRHIDRAPLNTRGWVMQERLLSRRILHFGASMIYWKCRSRSTSELNPLGYTYKRYPEDFTDDYFPDIKALASTVGDFQRAERDGRGISWASKEEIRRRPPPATNDPDSLADSKATWKQRRGFWKNVLMASDLPWGQGEGTDDTRQLERSHAGFRASFELLRSMDLSGSTLESSAVDKVQVGMSSFSQKWYDVVEMYSRTNVTNIADRLVALGGIESAVAAGAKYTYLYGLWEEVLVTNLLWFAIEGPGSRALTKKTEKTGAEGKLIAPTWSWASIEGPVAVDLLPENANWGIEAVKKFVTIYRVDRSLDIIDLQGPIVSIKLSMKDGKILVANPIGGEVAIRVFPDVTEPNIVGMSGVVCMTFLALRA